MNICKRYSEFDDLRGQLIQTFPNFRAAMPELPPKSVISKFRPRFLEKRRAGLQYFLKYVPRATCRAAFLRVSCLLTLAKLYIAEPRVLWLSGSQGILILMNIFHDYLLLAHGRAAGEGRHGWNSICKLMVIGYLTTPEQWTPGKSNPVALATLRFVW